MKRGIICLLLSAMITYSYVGPDGNTNIVEAESVELNGTVSHDTKFGSANLSFSEKDLEDQGIQLGDCCSIEFENGYILEDVPYYSGYYVPHGAPVMVAYPGMEYVSVTYNNVGIWDQAGLQEGDAVSIRLCEAEKYADIQGTLGQLYSFERDDYTTDEQYCNFRPLTGGRLKDNFLYRGASPVDNSRGRAAYTDRLLSDQNIRFILDLADSEEDMQDYLSSGEFCSEYAEVLYRADKMVLLDMGSSFQSDAYKKALADGFRTMTTQDGPVYIHCMEGKDRTGFACFLLEALAGASYEEMQSDYMQTYCNYYSVTETDTKEKYEAISELYFDTFASYLHGTDRKDQLLAADYSEDAARYLLEGGMNESEINELIHFISQ